MGSELVNKSVGGGINHAFTTPNHNGNLYNQENDRPVADGKKPIQSGKMEKDYAKQKMARMRVGAEINYNLGRGTIVSKRGDYLTIAHTDGRHVDTIHVGEAWQDGERVLYDKLWDQLAMETRNDILSKHQLPLAFINRSFEELPREVVTLFAEVYKEDYFEPSAGGHAGREPGVTRDDESRSFRDTNQTAGRNDPPQSDKRQAPGLKKAYETIKSDVEHGMYGGITTDQEPLEAKEDYEEDKREGDRKQLRYQDHDAADNKDINPDAKSIKVKGKTPPGAEMDDVDKEGAVSSGAVTTGTAGVNNTVFNKDVDGPDHAAEGPMGPERKKSDEALDYRNKYNKRPGQQMSPAELKEWHEKNQTE